MATAGYGLALEPDTYRVELINQTGEMIISTEISHGNADTEEQIKLFRIANGERRTVVLNHQPGMGFRLVAQLQSGATRDYCTGKANKAWRWIEVIHCPNSQRLKLR